MNKLFTSLALLALLAPAAASAKSKSATPVYKIYGGYDLTSVIYSSCMPPGGGVSNETTRVKRHFSYSGDTKRGFTVTETEQEFLIRESTNEFLPSNTITGEPSTRTYHSTPIKTTRKGGVFSYQGISDGGNLDKRSFKLPKKVGDAIELKPESSEKHNDPDPGVGCTIAWDSTETSGALLIKRIR